MELVSKIKYDVKVLLGPCIKDVTVLNFTSVRQKFLPQLL